MSPALRQLFIEYADAHQHPMNQLTHKVAIPMIVFHIVAMLDWVALFTLPGGSFPITVGVLAWVWASAWYLRMGGLKLGLIMTALVALCLPLARVTPGWVVIVIAVVGWLVQLAGHVVWEKRSPAFVRNLVQGVVGPVYFVALLTGDWKLELGAATR